MDLHRLRVVGFDTLANVENGNNKNIAEHEESKTEDAVIDEDDKPYETNELDEASDKKCTEDNVVSSGSSKFSNFMNRKSKSEIFRIPSRNKLQNRDLKINSSFEDLPKELKHRYLNKKKKTLKLFNRRSTADFKQKDLRKRVDASHNHEDIHFLFTRETPSFVRYSKKRAKHDRPKIGSDQKYSNDLYGFKKSSRYFDPYLYPMSCNYLNIDKFPLKKLRNGFRRKGKTKAQPSKDCTCKHHAMRVLNSAVKSSDRGDKPSIYYNLSTVHSHVRRHRRKRDVTFRRNEPWARETSTYAMHKDQNVAVSPSSLAPLKRCCCDACVGSSKLEIMSRPCRRPPAAVYRDATSSHHKPPGKLHLKPSPQNHHKPSSQDSSLSHHKLLSEHTLGSSNPMNENHLYKPQFVVCKSRKSKKKKRKSSFLNIQRKKIFRGFFQNIAAFHTKSRISGKNCIKYVFFGLLIVVWSPCLLAVILAWVVMCPVRLTNMLANDKNRKTFAFWKSFTDRFRKKSPGSDYKRMCCEHCSRQNRKSFMTSVASWYARAAGTVMTSFNALISMIKSKKARSCGSSFMTTPQSHPNPRKRYTLYYADNRGWMMKPTRRSNYNRSSNRVVQSMRCEFRPKFWSKPKTDLRAQMEMETSCSNVPVQCPVHGDKCAKNKALKRKKLSPAGDAGQMPSEFRQSCICDAYLKWSKSKKCSAMVLPETSSRNDPGQKVNIPLMQFNQSYGKASTSQNYQHMNTNPTQFNLNNKNEMEKKMYPKCQSQWKSGTLPLGVMFNCPCGTKHPIITNREVYQTHMFGLAGKTLNFSAKYTPTSKLKGSLEEPIKSRIALNCPCDEEKSKKKIVNNRKKEEITKTKQIKLQPKDIPLKQKKIQSQSSTKRIALNCPCDEPSTSGGKLRSTRGATDLGHKAHKHQHHHRIRICHKGISAQLSQSALTRQAKTSTIEIVKCDKQTLTQKFKYLVDTSQNVSKNSFSQQKTELVDRSQNASKTDIYPKNNLIDRSQNVSKQSFGQNKKELIDRSQNMSKDAFNVGHGNASVECGCWTDMSDKKGGTESSLIERIIKSTSNISQKLSIDKAFRRKTRNCLCGSSAVDCACRSQATQCACKNKTTINREKSTQCACKNKPTINAEKATQCACKNKPTINAEKATQCACNKQIKNKGKPSECACKNKPTINKGKLAECACNKPIKDKEKPTECACYKPIKDKEKPTECACYKPIKNKEKPLVDCECNTEITTLKPFCPCPKSCPGNTINKETITSKQQSSTIQREKIPLKQSVPYKLAIDCGCETDKQLTTAADCSCKTTSEKKKRPKFFGKCLCSEPDPSPQGKVICKCWPEKKEKSKEKVECGCGTDKQSSVTFKDTVPKEQDKPSKLMVDCGCGTDDLPNSSVEESKLSLTPFSQNTSSEAPSKIDIALNCPCGSSHKPNTKYTDSTTISKKTSISSSQDPGYKITIKCTCPASMQLNTNDRETLTGTENIIAKKPANHTMVSQRFATDKSTEAPSKLAPVSSKPFLSAKMVDCACGPDLSVGDKKSLNYMSAIPTQQNKYRKLTEDQLLMYGMASDSVCEGNNTDMGSLQTQKSVFNIKTGNEVMAVRHGQIINNLKSASFPYGVAENCTCAKKRLTQYKTDSIKKISESHKQEISPQKLLPEKDSSQQPKQKSVDDKDKRPTQVKPLSEQKHPSSVQAITKTPQKQSVPDEKQKIAVNRKTTHETSSTRHPSSKVTKDPQSQTLRKRSSLYGIALDCPCDSIEELSSKPPRTTSVGISPDNRPTISKSTAISSSKLEPTKHLQSTQTPPIASQKQAAEDEEATDCECVTAEDENVGKPSIDKKRSSGGQESSAVKAQPLKSKSSDCECSNEIAILERRLQTRASTKSDEKTLRSFSTDPAEHPNTPCVSPECTCLEKLKINKSSVKVPFSFKGHRASQTRPTQMSKKKSDHQNHIPTKSSLTEEPKQAALLKYPRETSLTKISPKQQKQISHELRDTSQMLNKLKKSFNKMSKKKTLAEVSDDLPDTPKRSGIHLKPHPKRKVNSKVQETQTKSPRLGRQCFCPPGSRSRSYKKRSIDYSGTIKEQLSKRGRANSNSYQSQKSLPETSKLSSLQSSRSRHLEERLNSLRRRISSLQRLPPCSCDSTRNRSSARTSRQLGSSSISDKKRKEKCFYPVLTSRHRISQTSLKHTECLCPVSDCKVPVGTRSHLFQSVVVNKSQNEKPQILQPKPSVPHSPEKKLLCPDQVVHNSSKRDKKQLKLDQIKKSTPKNTESNYQSSKEPFFHSECACPSDKPPVPPPTAPHLPPSTKSYASSRLSRLVMKLHCKMFSRKKCPQKKTSSPSTQCSISRHSKKSHLSTIPVSVQQTPSLHTRKSTLEDKSQLGCKRNSQILRQTSHTSSFFNSKSRFHEDYSKYPSGYLEKTPHILGSDKLDKPCTCSITDSVSQQSRQSVVSNVSCSKCFSYGVPSLQLSSIKTSNQTPKSLVCTQYDDRSGHILKISSAKKSHSKCTCKRGQKTQNHPTHSKCTCKRVQKTLNHPTHSKCTCKRGQKTLNHPTHSKCTCKRVQKTISHASHSKCTCKRGQKTLIHPTHSKCTCRRVKKTLNHPTHSHRTQSSRKDSDSEAIRDSPHNSQKRPLYRSLKAQQTTKTSNLSSTYKSPRLRADSVTNTHFSNRTNQISKGSSLSQHTKSKVFTEKLKHYSHQLSRHSHMNEKSFKSILPEKRYCDQTSEKISQLSNKTRKHSKSPPIIRGACYSHHISKNKSQSSSKSAFENKFALAPCTQGQGSQYSCTACLENEGQSAVFHQHSKVSESVDSKLNVATSFSTFRRTERKQLPEKLNNPEESLQMRERNKQENIDPQKQVLQYSSNQPIQRYPLHPFIPVPILPGKCSCAESQRIKSENIKSMKDAILNPKADFELTPSVLRRPESHSAKKLRLLSEKVLPQHKATMKTEEPPTPSEKNQPPELIRHFPRNSTVDTEEPNYSEHLSIRKSSLNSRQPQSSPPKPLMQQRKSTLSKQSTLQNQPLGQQGLDSVSYLPRRTIAGNENQPRDSEVNLKDQHFSNKFSKISKSSLSRQSTPQNQPALKEPSKSEHQLLEFKPIPAIPIIPGVCKCSRNQSEYSKLQQASANYSKNAIKDVEPAVPYISLSQPPKKSSNSHHISSTPIQSAGKQQLSPDPVPDLQKKTSIKDNEVQNRIPQSHPSEQTKIPQKSPPLQQIQPRRIIPGMCTCSISKDRKPPAIVQNQLQKSASESKFQPQILNHQLSLPHRVPHQPSHINRIEQPQSFVKKKRNSYTIGQTQNIHPSRCQSITIQRSEVSHNRPGSLRFNLPVLCPNQYDDDCPGYLKSETVSYPNKMSRHVLSTTTPVDKPPGLLQQHSTEQVHPVRKRSTNIGKKQKSAQPANAQQYPVGPPNMPPPQPDFNRVAMRYPGHNPKPEHIPPPANYYYPSPAAGVPPPNYARLPCFINPLNSCGPKSSGDEQSLRRAYKRRPIRFTPPKQQEKIPKTKAKRKTKESKSQAELKKVAEVKKKYKKKKGGNKISRLIECVQELVSDAEREAWPIAVGCRPLYIHAMRRRPCFWVYECCPSLYPMFLSCYKFQENICQMFMYLLSICFWCPLILCVYFCCDLICGGSN